jgi:hypothetical protein
MGELGELIYLTNATFLDKKMRNNSLPDKAKPFVRRGRKAAGPAEGGTAELPKDGSSGGSAFLFYKED